MSQDNTLDGVILDMFPVVAIPPSGKLDRPQRHGQRYLVSRSGVFREVFTPWLYVVYPIATISGQPTPYGRIAPEVNIECNMPPMSLWKEFLAQAKAHLPNECAGVFVWNTKTREWRMAMRESISASSARVDYSEARIGEDEVVVVDVHSHASHKAFFSSRDDQDDAGGIKIAAVVGKVDTPAPTVALRLVCLDRFRAAQLEGEQIVVNGWESV